MSAELLRDLARVKAVFQLRTIEVVIRGNAQGMQREARERECGPGPSGLASPVRKDAPSPRLTPPPGDITNV